MLCGAVGAGKTTYGRVLARERGALFFAIDDWMATLFMVDAPSPMTLAWALPRTERCEAQIWKVAQQALAAGLDVALELGFYRRDQRDRFRALAAAASIPVQVHHLVVPAEVRRERVRARNRGSATFTVEVDDAMFAWAEGYYEPLTDDELRGAIVVPTSRG